MSDNKDPSYPYHTVHTLPTEPPPYFHLPLPPGVFPSHSSGYYPRPRYHHPPAPSHGWRSSPYSTRSRPHWQGRHQSRRQFVSGKFEGDVDRRDTKSSDQAKNIVTVKPFVLTAMIEDPWKNLITEEEDKMHRERIAQRFLQDTCDGDCKSADCGNNDCKSDCAEVPSSITNTELESSSPNSKHTS